MADYPGFKIAENKYPTLSNDAKKEHLGRLKALGDISSYIDIIRESLTRELFVNGVKEESDIYKGLDNIQEELDAQAEKDILELKKNDSNSETSDDDTKTIVI
jgi:hypothetical protein